MNNKQLIKIAEEVNAILTLDQAIRHLQEDVLPNMEQCDCKKEHEQLLKWLIELKQRRQNDNQ